MKSKIIINASIVKDSIIFKFKNDPLITKFFNDMSANSYNDSNHGNLYNVIDWSFYPPRWQIMLNDYEYKTKLISKTYPNMSLLRSVYNETQLSYSGLNVLDDIDRYVNLFKRYHIDFIKNILNPYYINLKLVKENKEKINNGMYFDKTTNRYNSILKYEVLTV